MNGSTVVDEKALKRKKMLIDGDGNDVSIAQALKNIFKRGKVMELFFGLCIIIDDIIKDIR